MPACFISYVESYFNSASPATACQHFWLMKSMYLASLAFIIFWLIHHSFNFITLFTAWPYVFSITLRYLFHWSSFLEKCLFPFHRSVIPATYLSHKCLTILASSSRIASFFTIPAYIGIVLYFLPPGLFAASKILLAPLLSGGSSCALPYMESSLDIMHTYSPFIIVFSLQCFMFHSIRKSIYRLREPFINFVIIVSFDDDTLFR